MDQIGEVAIHLHLHFLDALAGDVVGDDGPVASFDLVVVALSQRT